MPDNRTDFRLNSLELQVEKLKKETKSPSKPAVFVFILNLLLLFVAIGIGQYLIEKHFDEQVEAQLKSLEKGITSLALNSVELGYAYAQQGIPLETARRDVLIAMNRNPDQQTDDTKSE